MAKYIFTKPFSTKVTVGGVVGIRNFSYNIGDIVEGTVVPNNQTSEPPSFLVVDGTSGLLKIGFGGRGWNNQKFFEPYSGTGTTSTPPTKSETTTDGSGNQQKLKTETQSFFTPKNIIIGVLAIGAIFGILKLTKAI